MYAPIMNGEVSLEYWGRLRIEKVHTSQFVWVNNKAENKGYSLQ